MFGFKKNRKKEEKQKVSEIIFHSPGTGTIIPMEDVNDPVFAQKMMGDGFALVPEGGVILAPMDGEVVMVADTAHAVGFKADDASILLHCGLDTVNLRGKGLRIPVKTGQKVHAGDTVLFYDEPFMEEQRIDMTSPVIVTDPADFRTEILMTGKADPSTVVMKLTRN